MEGGGGAEGLCMNFHKIHFNILYFLQILFLIESSKVT
jgi:hypothetical protein